MSGGIYSSQLGIEKRVELNADSERLRHGVKKRIVWCYRHALIIKKQASKIYAEALITIGKVQQQ